MSYNRCHCGKSQPYFNLPGLKAGYCSKCKTDDMINIRNVKKKRKIDTEPTIKQEGIDIYIGILVNNKKRKIDTEPTIKQERDDN